MLFRSDQNIPFDVPLSVAHGNVVLVDAGRTRYRPLERLNDAPGWLERSPRPRLLEHPLTRQGTVQSAQGQWQTFDPSATAKGAMQWSLRNVKPAIRIWENKSPAAGVSPGPQWLPQPDLLISDRFARHFVVETEEDGRVFLRFEIGRAHV